MTALEGDGVDLPDIALVAELIDVTILDLAMLTWTIDGPVSYTHLQTSKAFWLILREADIAHSVRRECGIVPVSDTHLDVYKRQR